MQAAKNWCDGERVKKLGILKGTKQGLGKIYLFISTFTYSIFLDFLIFRFNTTQGSILKKSSYY